MVFTVKCFNLFNLIVDYLQLLSMLDWNFCAWDLTWGWFWQFRGGLMVLLSVNAIGWWQLVLWLHTIYVQCLSKYEQTFFSVFWTQTGTHMVTHVAHNQALSMSYAFTPTRNALVGLDKGCHFVRACRRQDTKSTLRNSSIFAPVTWHHQHAHLLEMNSLELSVLHSHMGVNWKLPGLCSRELVK